MKYGIHITRSAEKDILDAADYIEVVLKNPTAADHLLDEVDRHINSLSELPERIPLVNDTVLASWGVRFVIINNYLAFYVVDKTNAKVTVVRLLYQKSNWKAILRSGFSVV